MKSSLEIASQTKLRPIAEVAAEVGLLEGEVEPWGRDMAKVSLSAMERLKDRPVGKLVLVTTITPTPHGEGKTTVTIGLAQALRRLGKKALFGIREPSLGPCMGMKGGAAGGGMSQVLPMEDINLHFTGDIHAVSAAHNLLAAMLDNHLHHGNRLRIDQRKIVWRRVMDMDDRSLRSIVVGLGGQPNGIPREDGFYITAASEVMAILCLASGIEDLKARLSRIIVAYDVDGKPVTAGALKAVGAMAMLLKHALKPNLVQTVEGGGGFVHGGPFANIAHGASSLMSTQMGLRLGELFLTEAGFGSDLGAQKFFDIVCGAGGLRPDAVVLVVTVRALKHHGGARGAELEGDDPTALKIGKANMARHLQNLHMYGVPVVIAVNRFPGDRDSEIRAILDLCEAIGAPAVEADVYSKGGEGGEALARELLSALAGGSSFTPLYPDGMTAREKVNTIATHIYGASSVAYSVQAESDLELVERLGLSNLPVCIAKTQYSLSDDPKKMNAPKGFKLHVREVRISAGAGFLVPMTGSITTMPGLPDRPAAEKMDIESDGSVHGLF